MLILFLIFGFVLLILAIRKLNGTIYFERKVKELFAQAKKIEHLKFNKNQLASLPEPVQRYFNHILKEGQPYISYVRMKHIGKFKAGIEKKWMNINGVQYVTTQKPGFIWKGTTAKFVAQDSFIAGKGSLKVTLFSLLNVINASGESYDQGELLRWLGESILYPTNVLPSKNVEWLPIDAKTAKLTFKYKRRCLSFFISVNEIGEITEMKTKRFMDGKKLETWIIKVSNYKELNAILVPTSFEVIWRLEKEDFSYAKFDITEIEYDKPYQF